MKSTVTHLDFETASVLAQFNATQWFDRYWEVLSEENSRVNLVSRETKRDDFARIIAEALLPFTQFQSVKGPYLDIGSGGGIPAIPILLSGIVVGQTTLYERTKKKATALGRMVAALGLESVKIIPESFGERPGAGKFSLVTLSWVSLTPPLLGSIKEVMAPEAKLVYYSRPDFKTAGLAQSVFSYSQPAGDIHKFFSIITK